MPATPFLRLDAAQVTRNIARLASYAGEHGLGVRPHTKTHKSLHFAWQQLEAGAIGLTVAKPGEAEVMAQLGADLLIAFPVIDPEGCRRIAELARENTVRMALDSTTAADAIAVAARRAGSEIGVLADLDVGMHRTGTQSPQAALELAQYIDRAPGLRLEGLFCYPGHVWNRPSKQAAALQAISAQLAETRALFRSGGLATSIVSGGSTPTAYQSHLMPELTEIRPGTSIFNDRNTLEGGFCTLEDCAARIVCTVVSDAVPGQVVIDAGTKTLTSDRCIPAPDSGHGLVVEYPAAKIFALSEEHGQIDIRGCDRAPKIGDRLSIVPNHICPCVNLQDTMWLATPTGELAPLPVNARGRVS